MITRGLGWVPGIASAKVSLGDHRDQNARSSFTRTELPIETLQQKFGCLELELSSRRLYLPYEPFVRNLAATIALWLESQQRRRLLEIAMSRLEVALRERSQALEESRAAVGVRETILAVVSHDLRTPLSAIMHTVRLLGRAPSDERTQGRLDVIDRASKRMNRMISDLLDFASIDAGRVSMDLRPHEVRDLVAETIEEGRSHAARKGIQLDVRIPSSLPAVVCDGQRIVQVLANLVGNAVKFTPHGGRVEVRAADENDALVLSVEDTGPGIPEDELPRIFEPFYRSRQAVEEGKGLGLTIAKRIVELHGGTLRAENRPGGGSRFMVALPRGTLQPFVRGGPP
jgi:signal transduction histidine kinase